MPVHPATATLTAAATATTAAAAAAAAEIAAVAGIAAVAVAGIAAALALALALALVATAVTVAVVATAVAGIAAAAAAAAATTPTPCPPGWAAFQQGVRQPRGHHDRDRLLGYHPSCGAYQRPCVCRGAADGGRGCGQHVGGALSWARHSSPPLALPLGAGTDGSGWRSALWWSSHAAERAHREAGGTGAGLGLKLHLSRSTLPGVRPAAATGALPPSLAVVALLLVGSVVGLVLQLAESGPLGRAAARRPFSDGPAGLWAALRARGESPRRSDLKEQLCATVSTAKA